mmetsp:Transcript_6864/g.25639  ORF Transcript_6864/g.25639 Transcript_6864/m.25639 type:complete len:416 (+) Transcript_6864:1771-3018(+)
MIATSCRECSAGSCCPDGMNSKFCNPGKWSIPRAVFAEDCFMYTNATVCFASNKETPETCSGNLYANPGHIFCQECPAGFYTNNLGEYCKKCEAGWFCPNGVDAHLCEDGLMSLSGSSSCDQECDAGYACSNGKQVACKGKWYSTTERSSACVECLPGSYTGVEVDETAKTCTPCLEGFYCLDDMSKTFCPSGTWSAGNASTKQEYTPCTEAIVCFEGKKEICKGSDYAHMHERCRTCPQGYHTSNAGTDCVPCHKDHFCPNGIDMLPCPHGYTSYAGASSCDLECPSGSSCSNGLRTLCTNNTFSIGKASNCSECPLGYYTVGLKDSGNVQCFPCPSGYRCDGVHQLQCHRAPSHNVKRARSALPAQNKEPILMLREPFATPALLDITVQGQSKTRLSNLARSKFVKNTATNDR